jgi:hypothetical protein
MWAVVFAQANNNYLQVVLSPWRRLTVRSAFPALAANGELQLAMAEARNSLHPAGRTHPGNAEVINQRD